MKYLSYLTAIIGMASLTATAQEAAPKAPAHAAPAAQHAIGKAIEHTKFVTEHKPNAHAKYYMYLCTAYWCGPCRREMPHIIAEYEKMRKDGYMEIIVLSCDNTPKAALQYMELFSAPFAVVMYHSDERKKLPGAPENLRAIPHIVITDAEGNVLLADHASRYVLWREVTKKQ